MTHRKARRPTSKDPWVSLASPFIPKVISQRYRGYISCQHSGYHFSAVGYLCDFDWDWNLESWKCFPSDKHRTSQGCKFMPSTEFCGNQVNECDLPERCNGTSSFQCPEDGYAQDWIPCSGSAYYYQKRCNTVGKIT